MEVKPGYRSTEFWLTLFAHLLTALVASGVFASDSRVALVCSFVMSTLAQLGYTASRAFVKATEAPADKPAL